MAERSPGTHETLVPIPSPEGEGKGDYVSNKEAKRQKETLEQMPFLTLLKYYRDK